MSAEFQSRAATEAQSDAGFTPAYYARQDRFAQTQKYREELDRLSGLLDLRPGMLVLDIGCSTGRAAAYLEERHAITVVRLDAPAAWLQAAPQPLAVRGDGHALPFLAEVFDAVYLCHAIGHVGQPDAVLRQARTATKIGGRLAIVTPNRRFIYALRPLNWARVIRYTPDPTVRHVFSLRRLVACAVGAGWEVDQAEYGGVMPDYLRGIQRARVGGSLRERLFLGAQRSPA